MQKPQQNQTAKPRAGKLAAALKRNMARRKAAPKKSSSKGEASRPTEPSAREAARSISQHGDVRSITS